MQAGNPKETRDDGSSWFLAFYTFTPEDCVAWASGYHEKDVSLGAVQEVFAHAPLTQNIIKALRPECD